jgi:hypothetical protein
LVHRDFKYKIITNGKVYKIRYYLSKFIPCNKDEACAMERGWTYLAIGSDINVNVIDGHYSTNSQHYRNMLFTKFIINRQ